MKTPYKVKGGRTGRKDGRKMLTVVAAARRWPLAEKKPSSLRESTYQPNHAGQKGGGRQRSKKREEEDPTTYLQQPLPVRPSVRSLARENGFCQVHSCHHQSSGQKVDVKWPLSTLVESQAGSPLNSQRRERGGGKSPWHDRRVNENEERIKVNPCC